MAKTYINVLSGDQARDAIPILATSDPAIVQAVLEALIRELRRRLPSRPPGGPRPVDG